MNESTYIKWIKDNGAELAAAALQNGNRSEIASNLLTHTSGLDARYKLTCAEAGRCDPFTTGMLALNGRAQEAIVNATLNLMFEKGGQAAGIGANVGGLAMDALKMNSIYRMIEDSQQAINDYQRIQEIGSWGLIKEKSGGAWTAISGYFGNGWDVATYEIGFNQKWNLADIVGNGFTKGDMGLDAALALVSMGDIAALRAAATARKVAALEGQAAKALVDLEAEALKRISNNPNGPDLTGRVPGTNFNTVAVRGLDGGVLPGKPIGGPGTPREMPSSPNPTATAENFVLQLFGSTPVSKKPMAGCAGCWRAQLPDGGWVTYRPAGQASHQTASTTATVEINSPRINSLNANKTKDQILKLKFPVRSEVP